jgi:hypothetical protein
MTRIVSLFVLLQTVGALATTWAPSEKTDPLSGEKVPAEEIMTAGSYIYDWPSKYDLVFWPLTAENWICFNPKNGYGAFNSHFEQLSEEEKKALTKWLAANYNPSSAPQSYKEKLVWLEKLYRLRKMDDNFWNQFYRLMAYIHHDEAKKSLAYVKKALPLLQKKLEENPEGIDRIEVLYLLGEYHRRIWKTGKAKDYFSQVKSVRYRDREGIEQVENPYFMNLVQHRVNLMKNETRKRRMIAGGIVVGIGLLIWYRARRKSLGRRKDDDNVSDSDAEPEDVVDPLVG